MYGVNLGPQRVTTTLTGLIQWHCRQEFPFAIVHVRCLHPTAIAMLIQLPA
jgi:hypothetical protein